MSLRNETTIDSGGGREAAAAAAMEAMRELEALQTRLLQRITALEISLQTQPLAISDDRVAGDDGGTTVARLSAILRNRGVDDFVFKRVPSDYYDRPLEARRDILEAASVEHLCKSIVLVCFLLCLCLGISS